MNHIIIITGNGRVLVVDGNGSLNGAIFDSAMVNIAQQNGWKGIILNGVVRDADTLKSMPFGIKAIGSHPVRGQQQGMGQTSVPVNVGGVSFTSGCWVYADKVSAIILLMQ